ncbi:AAA-domain-containing protein [Punctularia strigosozonata HHB-11173 SS5]|uniref:AAA-domain-containing protein n=1 Tax=Punctularia strigosozonata (strain HHB-11173) TaxID=741275 RepID=UPI000441824C|nr:AAA-domain-containing protein [Punctularia strigosozonata HHB-11173 SS5]EIN07593.1 AAA-domain-containing protein [Punctularia strigosozonata HHB-11173 SS5]
MFYADTPIIHQGTTHRVHIAGTGVLEYEIVMTEPVMQGYVSEGETELILVMKMADDLDANSAMTNGDLGLDDPADGSSEEEDLSIDERFLAGSVLMLPAVASSNHPEGPEILHGQVAGSSSSVQAQSFLARPLQESSSSLEEDFTVYLNISALSRVGILEGDWAVAHDRKGENLRLVRVRCSDDLSISATVVKASPLLLHNISTRKTPASSQQVFLRPSPFGNHMPPIPTARTVTIARVASPASVSKTLQPIFFRGLKEHFDGKKRLVKQGDLIAIPICTDAAQHEPYVSGAEPDAAEDANRAKDPLPIDASVPNEIVYFVVTNIENDVPSGIQFESPDAYLGATVGEFGCWIDTSVTRMVQTGIEHVRVPDMSVYLRTAAGPASILNVLREGGASPLLGKDSAFNKLSALIYASLIEHAAHLNLHLSILLKGARGIGKFTTVSWVAQTYGVHLLEVDCYQIIGENDTQTEGTLRARFEKAAMCSPCILVLRHVDALAQTTQAQDAGKDPTITAALNDCIDSLNETWKLTGYPVVVVGTTSNPNMVATHLMSCFKHEISMEAPDESERFEILRSCLSNHAVAPDVSINELATQTAALVASDLVDLVSKAKSNAVDRASRACDNKVSLRDLVCAGLIITSADIDNALDKARASYSASIGAPKIPNVSWDDVGGLAHVKREILDTVQLPLEHPELFADGVKKRSGVLLYGPPGTGKTLLAKAVATSCSLNFFSVKGPELLNMYIGESEANVRRVFQRARDAKPCVIFFDELDSVAPKRGNHGDSGGVMDRIVSQLLAELDGMSGGKRGADVFVIGATNRPDLLDPALLRPGRFDRMLYLGVSDDHRAQVNILEALTRKFRLHPDLNLATIAEQCPFNYTGADFYALCSDAMLKAMTRKAEELEAKIVVGARMNQDGPLKGHPFPMVPQYYLAELATPEDIDVLVSEDDFQGALQALVPSVSQSEMDKYREIQRRYSQVDGATTAVDG